jgi:hypothetical protein
VPVAATGQADVGAADTDPAVLLRVGEQVLEQGAVGALEGGALGEIAVRVGEPRGERVAHLLELPEHEHARRPGGLDPVRDDDPSQPLGDQQPEPPLQLADLPAQLGAREALVAQPVVLGSPVGD